MSLQALLFDLDGTLIDTNLIHARAFEKSFEQNGYKVAVDRIAIEIGKGGDLMVGAILVTTLEPCVMCAGAAMEAGIESVIYGMKAPFNGGVSRVSGIRTPGARFPRFLGGVLPGESAKLLNDWLDNNADAGGAAFVRQLLERGQPSSS